MSEILFPELDFEGHPGPNLFELLADIRAKHRAATIQWFGAPATLFTLTTTSSPASAIPTWSRRSSAGP